MLLGLSQVGARLEDSPLTRMRGQPGRLMQGLEGPAALIRREPTIPRARSHAAGPGAMTRHAAEPAAVPGHAAEPAAVPALCVQGLR
jgi:hypothetical protein